MRTQPALSARMTRRLPTVAGLVVAAIVVGGVAWVGCAGAPPSGHRVDCHRLHSCPSDRHAYAWHGWSCTSHRDQRLRRDQKRIVDRGRTYWCHPVARHRAAPTRPRHLQSTKATATRVSLVWSASHDDVGVTGYKLYLNGRKVAFTHATRHTFSGLDCGTTYRLAVRARGGHTSKPASTVAYTDPLYGVYSPSRLEVLDPSDPCKTAVGVVKSTRAEHDGDCHVNLIVDPHYKRLMNHVNVAHGYLVTEVVPQHPTRTPTAGSRVSVTGTWVHDRSTGWNELHPVWHIKLISGAWSPTC